MFQVVHENSNCRPLEESRLGTRQLLMRLMFQTHFLRTPVIPFDVAELRKSRAKPTLTNGTKSCNLVSSFVSRSPDFKSLDEYQ